MFQGTIVVYREINLAERCWIWFVTVGRRQREGRKDPFDKVCPALSNQGCIFISLLYPHFNPLEYWFTLEPLIQSTRSMMPRHVTAAAEWHALVNGRRRIEEKGTRKGSLDRLEFWAGLLSFSLRLSLPLASFFVSYPATNKTLEEEEEKSNSESTSRECGHFSSRSGQKRRYKTGLACPRCLVNIRTGIKGQRGRHILTHHPPCSLGKKGWNPIFRLKKKGSNVFSSPKGKKERYEVGF